MSSWCSWVDIYRCVPALLLPVAPRVVRHHTDQTFHSLSPNTFLRQLSLLILCPDLLNQMLYTSSVAEGITHISELESAIILGREVPQKFTVIIIIKNNNNWDRFGCKCSVIMHNIKSKLIYKAPFNQQMLIKVLYRSVQDKDRRYNVIYNKINYKDIMAHQIKAIILKLIIIQKPQRKRMFLKQICKHPGSEQI